MSSSASRDEVVRYGSRGRSCSRAPSESRKQGLARVLPWAVAKKAERPPTACESRLRFLGQLLQRERQLVRTGAGWVAISGLAGPGRATRCQAVPATGLASDESLGAYGAPCASGGRNSASILPATSVQVSSTSPGIWSCWKSACAPMLRSPR